MNWHVFPRCNYTCSFCYARFASVRTILPLPEARRVIATLAGAGTRKITFVGGEPLLHPHLPELVCEAKSCGMTTMVVTNAARLDADFLDGTADSLDWMGVSVDSANEQTQAALGRGFGDHVARSRAAFRLLREYKVRAKLNTVVTSLNCDEDMSDFVREACVERWKVFQVLPVAGENDASIERLRITSEQFREFVERHAPLRPVAEDNAAMTRSYAMIDPLGRFFQNSGGRYNIGRPLLEVGVEAAASDVGFDLEAFRARGGDYEWE